MRSLLNDEDKLKQTEKFNLVSNVPSGSKFSVMETLFRKIQDQDHVYASAEKLETLFCRFFQINF